MCYIFHGYTTLSRVTGIQKVIDDWWILLMKCDWRLVWKAMCYVVFIPSMLTRSQESVLERRLVFVKLKSYHTGPLK
jgi:hypothetical protein